MTAIISPIALVLLVGGAAVATGMRWMLLIRAMLRSRRPDPRFDSAGERIKAFFVYVLAQGRLLRWPYAGVLHALIFWGFLVLLTAIAQAIVEAVWQGFRFNDVPAAFVIAFAQDIFCVAVLAGVGLALINRLVVKPIRFRGSHLGDAVLILARRQQQCPGRPARSLLLGPPCPRLQLSRLPGLQQAPPHRQRRSQRHLQVDPAQGPAAAARHRGGDER
jgi:hypothetical protein